MRNVRTYVSVLVQTSVFAALIGCGLGASHWPPAVSSKSEIEALPVTQRDIRGIGVGDPELQLIAGRFHELDYLYLNSGSKVSDQGVAQLAKSNKLFQVVIMDASELTDQSIMVLASLPNLRELIITNAPKITDSSLEILTKKKGLKVLCLSKCAQLSESAKSAIKAALPECQILFQ